MKKTNDIPGISLGDMQKLKIVFDTTPALTDVVLYGSRAKGTYRPESDIDLTLKGSALATGGLMDLASQIDDLLLPYEVDLSIFEHIENADLINHINRIGKVIFTHE